LIVKLQDIGIVVYQVGKREFVAMALKLNSATHREGRICPAHIPGRTLDMACWRRGANVGNDRFRLIGKAQSPTPLLKCLWAEHLGALL